MKSNRFLLLLLIAVFSIFFVACGKSSHHLSYDIDAAPTNLDPQSAGDYSSQLVIYNMFEGLVRIGADGSIKPAAAERFEVSDDGLTLYFHLRPDGKWSDGSAVTANDFVFAFQRLFNADTHSIHAAKFYCIENGEQVYNRKVSAENLGVVAISPLELEIRLSEYDSQLLYLLTTAPAMPCQEKFFWETKGKYGLNEEMVLGNGAFYLSSWKEESLKLRRNAEYISENFPDTDSVTFTILSKMKMPATKENRFLNGKTSAVATDGSQIKTFPEKSGIIESNQNTVWGILFQLKDGAFSNANLRKSLIIDSDFLMMEEKLPLHFQRMRAIVPQNICIGDKRYRDLAGKDLTLPYQPIEAKELYQKGLAELKMKEVTNAVIIVPDGLGHEDYLSYLSQIWQRDLGLYLVVEVLDSESYEARLASGDFDCAIASLSGDYNSPSAILSDFSSGSPKNTIGFSNAEYDRLLIAAPKQVDPQKAAETYLQAEKILMEQGAFLPMYEQSTYFVKDQNAAGIRYNFDNKMVDFRMTSANENQAEKK